MTALAHGLPMTSHATCNFFIWQGAKKFVFVVGPKTASDSAIKREANLLNLLDHDSAVQ